MYQKLLGFPLYSGRSYAMSPKVQGLPDFSKVFKTDRLQMGSSLKLNGYYSSVIVVKRGMPSSGIWKQILGFPHYSGIKKLQCPCRCSVSPNNNNSNTGRTGKSRTKKKKKNNKKKKNTNKNEQEEQEQEEQEESRLLYSRAISQITRKGTPGFTMINNNILQSVKTTVNDIINFDDPVPVISTKLTTLYQPRNRPTAGILMADNTHTNSFLKTRLEGLQCCYVIYVPPASIA